MKHLNFDTRTNLAAGCVLLLVAACGSDDNNGSTNTPADSGTEMEGGSETTEDDSTSGSTDTDSETSTGNETSENETSGSGDDAGTDGTDGGGDSTEDNTGDTSTDTSTPAGGDAGTDGSTGVDINVDAVGAGQGALVGYPIELSATESTASDESELTYEWEIIEVPEGSEITSEDLSDAAADTAEFSPDLAGSYVVQLTVSSGDASASTEVEVTATAYDIGYLLVEGEAESSTRAGAMVRSDGSNPSTVGCSFTRAETSEESWLSEFRQSGQYWLRAYLPSNASDVARLAYTYENDADALMMQVVTRESDCGDNAPTETVGGFLPSFSPNGERVAFSRPEDDLQTLYTAGSDGTGVRAVRSGAESAVPVAVSWTEDGDLVWAEEVTDGDASHTQVYRVSDAEDAFLDNLQRDKLLDCSTATDPIPGITRAVLRGENLYVTSTVASPSGRSAWLLTPTATDAYSCDTEAMTNLKITDDNAWDVEVSPDGASILYYAPIADSEPSATELYLAPSDATGTPRLLAGGEAVTNTGAHFAGGGKQVIWTRTTFEMTAGDAPYERPVSSAVWVINTDGSSSRQLVETTSTAAEARMFHTGGTSACSMGVGRANGVALSGLLFGLGALVLRRRRN